MTHKERIFAAARGELPDLLPYVPRIDLWYNSNSLFGTLPERHRGRTQDEISRAEGWAIHRLVPEFLQVRRPEDNLHRALGLYSLKEMVFDLRFAGDVETNVSRQGDSTRVEYHTPLGSVSTSTSYTEEMKRAGASLTWIEEHVLKRPEDYRIVGYLFENLELTPAYNDFVKWRDGVGQDGIAATMVGLASSPMHHIQKEFLDATEFYYHYHDFQKEMRALAESVEHFFEQALRIIADSPAEAVLWGANFDDMITYPSYFEQEILPWIRRASETLAARGKVVICHCDGENRGLLDLIRDSGMHVAEAICPHPMTKVRIEEYYQRWSDKLTIFGGIPSNLLLADSASDEEFESYLDHLFQVIAPGRRMILGVADTTPPDASFERLVRIGERVEKEGRLPLEGGGLRPVSEAGLAKAAARVAPAAPADEAFSQVRQDVLAGRHQEIEAHIRALLEAGLKAQDILNQGLIAAMEEIGQSFKTGQVFIPEVLLSARAMNQALVVLEPHLAAGRERGGGKILIGTVRGDMHDIGKNMVLTMLRGVGYRIKDLGINVPAEVIVKGVADYRPDVLGLSALLTTTMPEMKRVIEELTEQGLRDKVKVIVGGAPVNAHFARSIGADGYAPDAGEAVVLVKGLLAG